MKKVKKKVFKKKLAQSLIPTPFAAAFTAAHSPRGEEIPSLRAQAMVAVGVMRRKLGRMPDSSRAAACEFFFQGVFLLLAAELFFPSFLFLSPKTKQRLLTAVTGIRE